MAYAGIHIPAGCEVQIGDNEASLASVGVLPEDSETTVGITYDQVEVKGSKNEDVQRYVKNMKGEAKFSIYQLLLDNIAKFAKGLMTVDTVAAAEVPGAIQNISAGWVDLQVYKLTGQNANRTVPTVTAVVADPGVGNKALAEGVDYFLVKGADGEWYIYFDTSGTAGALTTEAIRITSTYTPAANKTAKMGTASVEITPQVVRFIKEQGGKKFQVTLWSATNTSGLTFGFPASSSDKPVSLDVTLSGGLDTSRADGDQLVEIIDEIGVSA